MALLMSLKLAGLDEPSNNFQSLLAKLCQQNHHANLPKNEIELMTKAKENKSRKNSTSSISSCSDSLLSLESIESLSQNETKSRTTSSSSSVSSPSSSVDEGIWSSSDELSVLPPTMETFLPRDLLLNLDEIERAPGKKVRRDYIHLGVKEFFDKFRQQTALIPSPPPSPPPSPVNNIKVMYGSRDILDFEANVKESSWNVTHPWMPANQIWSSTETTDCHRTCKHCNHYLAPQVGPDQQQNICQMVEKIIAMDNY